jgi:hypothetical protein
MIASGTGLSPNPNQMITHCSFFCLLQKAYYSNDKVLIARFIRAQMVELAFKAAELCCTIYQQIW